MLGMCKFLMRKINHAFRYGYDDFEVSDNVFRNHVANYHIITLNSLNYNFKFLRNTFHSNYDTNGYQLMYFSVYGGAGNFTFAENTFYNNSLTQSLVYLDSNVIANLQRQFLRNSFFNNTAYSSIRINSGSGINVNYNRFLNNNRFGSLYSTLLF